MKDDFDLSKLTKKSKKLNSKAKGNRFERQIVEILNNRFNTKDFCRTPGSGAFATTHKLPEHLKIHGDLVTPKNFRFTLECKSGYNKESIESLFNPKSKIRQFIEQAERDSVKSKKDFILVIKQNNKEPVCILRDTPFLLQEVIVYKNYFLIQLKDLLGMPDSWFYE